MASNKDSEDCLVNVEIVFFPETNVAFVEHHGPPEQEHETAKILIAWKLENRLLDQGRFRSYGLHYTDSRRKGSLDHHVDFCLSIENDVAPNRFGVRSKRIPRMRCARARDIGHRYDNRAAVFLAESWLPNSGEALADFPIIFHYLNVGPHLAEEEMVTDVYVPLKEQDRGNPQARPAP